MRLVFPDSYPSPRDPGTCASDSFVCVLIQKNKPLIFNACHFFLVSKYCIYYTKPQRIVFSEKKIEMWKINNCWLMDNDTMGKLQLMWPFGHVGLTPVTLKMTNTNIFFGLYQETHLYKYHELTGNIFPAVG